jgi:signal transduction histidine kinase
MRNRTPEEYRYALHDILEEAERTSQVVDSLMVLARADSGNEALTFVETDVVSVVREAAEQGQKLARTRDSQFLLTLPEKLITLEADPDALRRAFLILMDNAVKYTPDGGSIAVMMQSDDGFVVISVADTGIGIAEQDLPHVFDRFWRADKARSREQGGTGLGLSIAHWIVEMHHGTISVQSKLGTGSRFDVKIPLEQPV